MKITILVLTLTCGSFVATYSQINHKRKGRTTENPPSFHYDIKPALDYDKFTIPNDFWHVKIVERFLPNVRPSASRTQGKTFVPDRMPCYDPEGVFSMRIFKPDTSTKYTLLVTPGQFEIN